MRVVCPEMLPKKSIYKNEKRDSYLRENAMIDPAILAAELGLSERFVKMRQRHLGIRKCERNRHALYPRQ